VSCLLLSIHAQGHRLDPSTAAAALDALHQEGAWDVAGLVLAACIEGGAAIGPVAIQRLLLSSALAGAWKAVRHVLQVRQLWVWQVLKAFEGKAAVQMQVTAGCENLQWPWWSKLCAVHVMYSF